VGRPVIGVPADRVAIAARDRRAKIGVTGVTGVTGATDRRVRR
jgi:hypothetical protein